MSKNKPLKQQKISPKTSRPVTTAKLQGTSAFEKFIDKHGLYTLFGLISVICFFVFKDFLLQKKIYLFKDIGSDSINIFYPQWVHIADYLRQEGIPKWSFYQGMGQNVYPSGLGDPFSLILYAVGSKYIANFIIYNEILKIFLAGFFFYLYLKTLNISNYTSIIGSLLYSFSGYMILGGSGWYAHSSEAFFAAFFLFSIERFYKKNQWYYIPLAVLLVSFCITAYFLFPYGMLLFFYFTTRFIDDHGLNYKLYFQKGIQIVGLYFLGILISSVYTVNFILTIYNSPRVTGNSDFEKYFSAPLFGMAEKMEYISIAMRMFSNDLIGVGNNFKGWMNYLESPILYIGLSTLLLAPQFFNQLNKRTKIVYGTAFAIIILALLFPYFRYAFWGFGLNYFRTFSFFVSVFLLFIAVYGLEKTVSKQKVNILYLGITLLLLLTVLYYGSPIKKQIVDTSIRTYVTIFLLGYAAIIAAFKYAKAKHTIKIVLLLVVCVELISFSKITTGKREAMTASELNSKTGYNDYTVEAINYLESIDSSFYRVTKYYYSGLAMHGSMNDALAQTFRGTISYQSFNQKYYIEFLKGVKAIDPNDPNTAKWANGVSSRPLLQSLVSNKYVLQKTNQQPLDTVNYKLLNTFGDVRVYKNNFYMPLGFAYDKYIIPSDFSKFNNLQMDFALYRSFVADENDLTTYSGLQQFKTTDTLPMYTWENLTEYVKQLRNDTLTIVHLSHNHIKGIISLEKKKNLFLSIPYDDGWKLEVNGIPRKINKVNYGLMGVLLDKGKHEISLTYEPPFMQESIYLSSASMLVYLFLIFWYRKRQNTI